MNHRWGSRADVLTLGALLAVLIAGFVWSPVEPIRGDGYYTYLWARSLAFDFDLDLANDYALCGDPWGIASRGHGPAEGIHNYWNPGPAVVWTPMIWLGRLLNLGTTFTDTRAAQGCSGPIASVAAFGTVLMGWFALLFAFRFCRRHFGAGSARFAVIALTLTTHFLYYTSWLPGRGHVPAAFAVAWFVDYWDSTRSRRFSSDMVPSNPSDPSVPDQNRTKRWVGLGLLLGLAMLMRPVNVVFGLIPLAEWSWRAWHSDRKRLSRLFRYGVVLMAAMLLAFSPQLYIWKHTYGTFFAIPQGPHFMRWDHPVVDGVFFASSGGLLVWTPFLLVSFFGIGAAVFHRRHRFVAVLLIVVFAIITYINSAVWDYWGSASFSSRRFVSCGVIFAFGFAAAFHWLRERVRRAPSRALDRLVVLLLVPFVIWNLASMSTVVWGRGAVSVPHRSDRNWDLIFTRMTRSVYRAVGNPLAWPASLPFAVRWDVHPRHYDVMRGMGMFYAEYEDRRPRPGDAIARFDISPERREFAVEGFRLGEFEEEDALVLESETGRLLVPFFLERFQSITFEWATEGHAEVQVEWDGVIVADVTLEPGWSQTEIPIPRSLRHVGTTEIRLNHHGSWIVLRSLTVNP